MHRDAGFRRLLSEAETKTSRPVGGFLLLLLLAGVLAIPNVPWLTTALLPK